MNAKRLTKLAEHLKTVKPAHFSMEKWGVKGFEKHECGAACAAGHACTIPSFKRAGLAMEYGERQSPVFRAGEHDVFYSYQALERFFDLEGAEVAYIFGYEYKRTPKQEARVIERFVKTGKVPAAHA